jgi:hypothetical protein
LLYICQMIYSNSLFTTYGASDMPIPSKRTLAGIDPSLRAEFADDPDWQRRASARMMRLPRWGVPVSVVKQRQWLRRLRVTRQEYLTATGYQCLEDFSRLNPDYPLRAFVGLLLVYADARDSARGVLRAYDLA